MATVEEMNVVIAEYMGYLAFVKNKELEYDIDWNSLMEVWHKLRVDLTHEVIYCNGGRRMFNDITEALSILGISSAHRLIYEAIVWLKQNKS